MPEKDMHSPTGGVKAMPIAGRMISERERLLGMSDAERAWRAQWLKDQVLAPDEPRYNPEYYKQRYNFIRRFYRAPGDKLERMLIPTIGVDAAYCCRHIISGTFFSLMALWSSIYYFKYLQSDWTHKSGWKLGMSRKTVFPNDPGYPNFETKTDREYATYGFEKSPI